VIIRCQTFADDTSIMAVGDSVEEAIEKFDKVNNWTRKWLIKLNEAKSVHVDFTNNICQHLLIIINDSHTSLKHSEISWHDAGCQDALEGTCQEKNAKNLD
jgi:hypothetical protein